VQNNFICYAFEDHINGHWTALLNALFIHICVSDSSDIKQKLPCLHILNLTTATVVPEERPDLLCYYWYL